MSHWTTITTQIKDPEALRAACAELGLTLLQNATARGYSNSLTRGEYVIQLKGPYDIAVNRQADGAYGLTTDWYQGHVAAQVGEKFSKLMQLYAVHKATLEARKRGHTVQRREGKNGNIQLLITT